MALPDLVDAKEVAAWLRTTRKAVYLMADRALLPPSIRIGRRLLWERSVLVEWLAGKRVASLNGDERCQ
jgi:predicted DNA-binding transcriptional regulator AlpA